MKTSTLRNAISIALLVAAIGTSEWAMAQDTTTDTATQGRAPVTKAPAKPQPKKSTDTSAAPAATNLQTVTVTGTRIRGGTTPSPVITIGSEQIQQEGFADLGEVIRSVPQNFSGGQNPGVTSVTTGGAGFANQNITGGSSLNLRGLGPDATLTLLNGRRMSYGSFVQAVDISSIPVDAVDRIEIVADGASAIYGSDAVGGVGNVILKRDYEGLTVGTRYGRASEGGLATREYNATAGAVWDSGGLIATYKDESVDPIYARQRSYTSQLIDPSTIYPGSDLRSGLLSVHQAIGDAVELHLDALNSKRQQLHHYYLLSGSDMRATPETTTSLVAPSIEVSLPNGWSMSASGSWGKDEHVQYLVRTRLDTGEAANILNLCYCNESRAYEIGAEGPVFAMHGGDARLAMGMGYRWNGFNQPNYITHTVQIEGDESSRFAYAEINLPLLGSDYGAGHSQGMMLTAAVRREDYQSFGSVTTPKLGLVYGPSPSFTLKGSWGKSFKAPTLFQRYYPASVYLQSPRSYGGAGYPDDATLLFLDGGNRELKPERARTWSASVAFHPVELPSMEAELTWFDIDYTDRVVQPVTNYSQALSNPIYSEFVAYSPTAEQQASVLAAADGFYNNVGAPYDPGKVVAILYTHYVNATRQHIKGADLSGSYRFGAGSGGLTIRGSSSWLDNVQQTVGTPRAYELAGTLFNPAKVTGRVGAVWDQGGLSASVFANYKSGVTDTVADMKMGSFTTFDATLRYSTGVDSGVMSGLELAVSVQNLFDRAPPLYTSPSPMSVVPYDSTNYSAIGRFWSISLAKHW